SMYLLALDTATNSGGVALARNAELVGLILIKQPLEYSERILRYVDLLIGEFGLSLDRIDGFTVAAGPGSFTGIRIGLATVKGFAQSLERPAVALSTLEALAFRFRHFHRRIAVMMDARRQQIFGGAYEVSETEARPILPEQAAPPAEWIRRLPAQRFAWVGDGTQMYASTLAALRPHDRILRTDNTILPELCRLAYERFVRGQASTAEELRANYLRASDAEQARFDPPRS
ncbi:MAG TPA: tRNA (adenosine(37)-N6)-threonylcarbamoyltransferase complex dimerization subunit type 1 TsaB, partial [Acidobacteriota bacterium]|nr:tRNA (adenosine(37)-N6)-threonylcarbamoyltransferase complex dimerization subunit type 1 TsaB [Acidobacteriota bacterium]